MKRTIIGGEVINIQTTCEGFDSCKYIRNTDTHLFTFFPVNGKAHIRRVGGVKAKSLRDCRVFISRINKTINNPLKILQVIISAPLLYLHTETYSRSHAWKRRRLYHFH